MGSLYARGHDLARAVRGEGVWLEDAAGKRYLDAAAGALVVAVGHGDTVITRALQDQASNVAYVHPTAFTTEATERYAAELASLLPMRSPSVFPVSGGSEAVESALKVARAYHLAKGQPSRSVIIGRELSYHGNTRGALDVGGRTTLREPYLPWLGLAQRVPGVLEYRCPNPGHPDRCAEWHAIQLETAIQRVGPDTVAAFIAEPIGGAASGAALPPEGYWEVVARVCRRHDVLIIADEVMTGFGRTGRWFASEHFDLSPDIVTMAKGASSGYWPLGVCAFSEEVRRVIDDSPRGLVHGFTYSHNPVGSAVGLAVLQRIKDLNLVESAETRGERLKAGMSSALAGHPHVGDIRGKGLLLGIELVADHAAKTPFHRRGQVAETVSTRARELGLIVYPSTGCADGTNGDVLLIGPPLIINDSEIDQIVEMTAAALDDLR